MTKEELWKIYCEKNPALQAESSEIRMSRAGIRKFFDQTYDYAYKQGKRDRTGKSTPLDYPPGFEDLFPGIRA